MPKFSFGTNKEVRDYLVKNKPVVSLCLTGLLFITTVITELTKELDAYILLYPWDMPNVALWYKLLTYPFFVGGYLSWLHNAIVIISAGYIIEPRLSRKKVVVLILAASVLGGLVYALINLNDPFNQPLAFPTMITWALSACAVTLIVKKLKKSSITEKVMAGLFGLSLLSISTYNKAFFFAQASVIILGIIFALLLEDKLTRVSDLNFVSKPTLKKL